MLGGSCGAGETAACVAVLVRVQVNNNLGINEIVYGDDDVR